MKKSSHPPPRPKRLSIKRLLKHVEDLRLKHGFKVVWGADKFYYNEIDRTVFLVSMVSMVDYISTLHEIGHSLTPEIRNVKLLCDRANRLVEKFDQSSVLDDGFKLLMDQMESMVEQLSDISNNLTNWQWRNEMLAWQYVVKNSLIWDNKFEYYIRECMWTYWINLGHSDKNLSGTIKSYEDFRSKFVDPIFG